jgi:hypothetical protein
VKYWYTWVSNTTSITGEALIYMNIKYYSLIFINTNVSPVILVVFDIHVHVYQCFTSYTCSVWYKIDIHEYQRLQV